MTMATMKVEGMTCGGCVQALTKALERVIGPGSVQVDLDSGVVDILRWDPAMAPAIRQAVEDAGFTLSAPPQPAAPGKSI